MRLLLVMPDARRAEEVRLRLYARWEDWEIAACCHGGDALRLLREEGFDLLLLQAGQQGSGGLDTLRQLMGWHMCCPPRVLLLCEPEQRAGVRADCVAPLTASPDRLCHLLEILAQKPLPILALQDRKRLVAVVNSFLEELSMPGGLKGRQYAAWLLQQLVPSPLGEERSVGHWYHLCAKEHRTSAAAVERCLRVAVESVFTQGSMQGIERCFGATVDPEKGKPTNRVFLLKAARLLRQRMADYSLTDTRSPNSSEMHHRPAAPTSV